MAAFSEEHMPVPQLSGQSLELFTFIQAQFNTMNQEVGVLRTAIESAAPNASVEQRFSTMDAG